MCTYAEQIGITKPDINSLKPNLPVIGAFHSWKAVWSSSVIIISFPISSPASQGRLGEILTRFDVLARRISHRICFFCLDLVIRKGRFWRLDWPWSWIMAPFQYYTSIIIWRNPFLLLRSGLQARSFGYDESRKTHILGCFNSFDNLLHAPTIQFSVSELSSVPRCLKST